MNDQPWNKSYDELARESEGYANMQKAMDIVWGFEERQKEITHENIELAHVPYWSVLQDWVRHAKPLISHIRSQHYNIAKRELQDKVEEEVPESTSWKGADEGKKLAQHFLVEDEILKDYPYPPEARALQQDIKKVRGAIGYYDNGLLDEARKGLQNIAQQSRGSGR